MENSWTKEDEKKLKQLSRQRQYVEGSTEYDSWRTVDQMPGRTHQEMMSKHSAMEECHRVIQLKSSWNHKNCIIFVRALLELTKRKASTH